MCYIKVELHRGDVGNYLLNRLHGQLIMLPNSCFPFAEVSNIT